MELLDFALGNRPPKPETKPEPEKHTIIFPPGAIVAVIGATVDRIIEPGQIRSTPGPPHSARWRFLPDGSVEATYQDTAELELALRLTQWFREFAQEITEPELPKPEDGQVPLFVMGTKSHYSEGL